MTELTMVDSDVHGALRESVHSAIVAHCEPADVMAIYDGDRDVVHTLWHVLGVELGLAGLLVAEDAGGAGASALEAAVVLEELGRAAVPVPFLTNSVIAATVLAGSASDELVQVAGGQHVAALAVPWTTPPHAALPAVDVDSRGRLSGTVANVAGAVESDVLLVVGRTGNEISVYSVPTSATTVHPVVSLDMTRQLADIDLIDVPAERLTTVGAAAVRRGLTTGAALLSSEQVGLAQWCLRTTVDYVQERKQFGRAIGSYQAIKHRLAELYIAVESANAAARYAAAAWALDDPDAVIAIAVAQSFCSETAVSAAEEAVQMHGGIGMTWEHPCHLYLKRAKADHVALGAPAMHRERLSGYLDLEI